jgi:hypothetical protein
MSEGFEFRGGDRDYRSATKSIVAIASIDIFNQRRGTIGKRGERLPLAARSRATPATMLAKAAMEGEERRMPIDDDIIQTPDGPITWGEWKRKNPVQIPSRRTKGKKLPVKVKRFTSDN